MSVTFTLHYKYTTIVQMTNSRRITVGHCGAWHRTSCHYATPPPSEIRNVWNEDGSGIFLPNVHSKIVNTEFCYIYFFQVIEKNGVQLFYFILLETVIASLYICWEAKHELRDYLIEQAGSNLFFRRKKLFANVTAQAFLRKSYLLLVSWYIQQQFALVRILDNNDKLTGAAYMMPDSLWKPFSIMCITIFVSRTFK